MWRDSDIRQRFPCWTDKGPAFRSKTSLGVVQQIHVSQRCCSVCGESPVGLTGDSNYKNKRSMTSLLLRFVQRLTVNQTHAHWCRHRTLHRRPHIGKNRLFKRENSGESSKQTLNFIDENISFNGHKISELYYRAAVGVKSSSKTL